MRPWTIAAHLPEAGDRYDRLNEATLRLELQRTLAALPGTLDDRYLLPVEEIQANPNRRPVNNQNGQPTSYTFQLSDAGAVVFTSQSTVRTWTLPPDSAVPFPNGTVIYVAHGANAGSIGVVRGTGVTLRLATPGTGFTDKDVTVGICGFVELQKIDTNFWYARGTALT